jgi:hypothetical protein
VSLQRIAALLAKAERTDNAAEAEAYLAKAQALATAASIDLAFARAAQPGPRVQPETRTLTIGERGKRANKHFVSLFIAIAHNNDAHVDIAHDSTFVVVYGMASDLDVVEQLFMSISVQMMRSAQEWVASGAWRGETYMVARTRRRKPHNAQTARAAFALAYVDRIAERLTDARERVKAADMRVRESAGALVLREKSAEIDAYHRRTSAARGRWGGYTGAVRDRRGVAAQAGRAAASRARLARSTEIDQPRALRGSGP